MASQTETPEQYRERFAAYVAGKDPIQMQEQAPQILSQLIEGVAGETLKRRPSPGKWSVTEIIAHLADDEIATSWRYRQMIQYSGERILGFDQDEWARLGAYNSWNPKEALELFRQLRKANLRMLANLSSEEWERSGQHTERGRMTVRELARHMAAHDMNHIEQIRRILHKE